MKYSLIDRSKAPRPQAKPTGAATQFDALVDALVPGKVARIELGGTETPRGIKVSLSRAAKRAGKRVRSWDADGRVYAELVDAPGQLPIETVADVSEV